MSDDNLFWPIAVVAALAILVLGAWVVSRNYDECRAAQHTALYCLTAGG